MSAVLMFAAISAIGGLVLGFYCVPWPVIVIPNLIIAIVSVIWSLYQNFSFLAGFAFVFGCLSLNQIAYVIGAAIIVFSEDPKASLTGDQDDDMLRRDDIHLSTLMKLKALLAGIQW
jgi:hypothetical protein